MASAACRATAVGMSGVMLALYLAAIGLHAAMIGLIVSLGLGGCALGTLGVTAVADRCGRRTTLALIAGLMAAGGMALAMVTIPTLLLAAILLGMVNGMGRDRGGGLTIEQAMLPQLVAPTHRTRTFAWYNVSVDIGHAVGSLLGGLPAVLRSHAGLPTVLSYRWSWPVYATLCLGAVGCALRLSAAVETRPASRTPIWSAASRPLVLRFAGLSLLDSLGGGFLTTTLLSYWFFRRFGVTEGLLGPLFCVVRIANSLSHLGAAWLAKRIGLVNTMVFTHLPSSLLLMTVPWAPNLTVAIVLFLIRESLVEMDVPTRQSYLIAIVPEQERIQAAGLTNMARSTAWAIAPAVAGSLMSVVGLSAPLILGPGLKVLYDVLLYRAFRHIRPPEEQLELVRA